MTHQLRVEITDHCNRRCPYCFFRDELSAGKREMSLDDFSTALDYCRREMINVIALQGGEPTTHTGFLEMIEMLRQRGMNAELFTNGIFDTRLLDRIRDVVVKCLLNYNHPDTYRNRRQRRLVDDNIARMVETGFPMWIGYTIYEATPDYAFFIDTIKKYRLTAIRWDLARPSQKATNRYFDLRGFRRLAPAIMKFCRDCRDAGAVPRQDCHSPPCNAPSG